MILDNEIFDYLHNLYNYRIGFHAQAIFWFVNNKPLSAFKSSKQF